MSENIQQLVETLAGQLSARNAMLTCAESCTGGWIAKVLTDRAGSSAWFDRGFVTYSNRAKQEMLGVAATTLATQGAVSRDTVLEMARGALANSGAQYAVSVSGVAGPGGGTLEKPVGTVWIAWAGNGFADTACEHFDGDREAVRLATVKTALAGLVARL